ncbi:MAG TPA: hypothetical protein DG048_11715 [Pseudoalteromonas sp.]|nr:hypothetical protein [Pseudoalteromonas sp.]|tara:strand:+ start:3319 stop:3501 length:183 start_codon:yes stop_codon:yes gene_type:complete
MDDASKIDRMIEVMQQLKELERMNAEKPDMIFMSLILALIHSTQIPDVTILGINKGIAQA